MGTVTFLYPPPIVNFVRAYIWQFNLPLTIINTALVGDILSFDTALPGHHWDLKVDSRFLPASSNIYSTDFIFDVAGSFHYFFGVPSPSSLNIQIGYVPGERELSVLVASEFVRDPDQSALLPQLSSYWLPRDPP